MKAACEKNQKTLVKFERNLRKKLRKSDLREMNIK